MIDPRLDEALCGIMRRPPDVTVAVPTQEGGLPVSNQYSNGTVGLTTPQRFFHYVEFTDSCWIWQAHVAGGGYGRFWFNGREVPAHRWLYEFCMGSVPDNLELDHLCETPPCVHPNHLEPVTHRENMLRGKRNVAGKAARRTQCPWGHPYNAANTYVRPADSSRTCRACQTIRRQRRAERKLLGVLQ